MLIRMSVVFGAGILLMIASCGKHPTSGTPTTPVSKYAPYWGLWQAIYHSDPETGKFKLLLNRDTTFSFSQVVDSNGAVFNHDSGTYNIDTASKVIRLVTSAYEGDYTFTGDTVILRLTWMSGHDFMFADTPASATWEFRKQ